MTVDRIEGNQLVEVNHDLDLLSMVTFPGERSGSPEEMASSACSLLRNSSTESRDTSRFRCFSQKYKRLVLAIQILPREERRPKVSYPSVATFQR
jgi:hypothetical protein